MAACDPESGEAGDLGMVSERGLESNGFQLNGFRLNGFRLNGQWLGAVNDDAVKLTHAHFYEGPAIMQAWLVGSNLHVTTEAGVHLSGAQLGGTELVFDLINDGVLFQGKRSKIVSVKPLPGDPDAWLYNVMVQDENNAWQPLCVDKDNVATEALLLTDVWDLGTGARVSPRPSGAVTIACRGAALAKCVEWGYAPWRVEDGVSLAETHQACTRAVRADYCGDGTPHTVNGVTIHVKDPLGIAVEDPNTVHLVEAEWGPSGALCLNNKNTRLPDPDIACDLPACGAEFLDKGKLQTAKLVDP